jgi:glycine/D-amino acid oxidase-like deaminating enzyme
MIKNIRTESPFWLMKSGFLHPYASLNQDIKTDFVIVGGGISGALMAWRLAQKGASVVLVDRRHIAMASTAASTSLLQYDIDRPLYELIEIMGEKTAVRAYELSLNALKDLEKIASRLKYNDFEPRLSIRFASFKKDVPVLENEFRVRHKNGFDVELWDKTEVAKHFTVPAPHAALLTRPSAIADPYRLTHALLQDAIKHGAVVFDKTGIKDIERTRSGARLTTARGHIINARKVVIACGYEAVDYVPFKTGKLRSTYAFASEPTGKKNLWHENASFWDTGDPYLYGRTTPDGRVIFGGLDEPFYSPGKRDALLNKKTDQLAARFRKMFPDVQMRVDYNWAGTFIETGDGLPYIGGIKRLAHTYFALGYGGNGITFSQLAAEILCDLLMGRKNKDAAIFSFDRQTD